MGEPFEVSQADRLATRALVVGIVESVRADREMPLPMIAISMSDTSWMPVFDRTDVEDFAMQMAQEIVALQTELEAMTAARDEAVAWLMETAEPSIEAEQRIAELRKVGR